MTAPITAITMPKWGLTMTEGKVVKWLQTPGASFAQGDEILEIETSKITNVVEADAPGTLLRVVAPEGTTLPIGALLAVIAPDGTPDAEIESFISGFVVVEPSDNSTTDAVAVAPRDLDIDGKRLRYLELGTGDGVPVLLVHGFGGDLNSWMFTQPALAEARRTIALDLPGHGGSIKDVGAGDAAAFTDVLESALAALGVERLHLVGHSMGGAIVVLLASRMPDRIASLTLIAPAGLGPEINAAFIDGFVRASRRKDAVEVLSMLVHDPALVSRVMVEEVLRYKRLDGVTAALETIANAWFAGGRQTRNVVGEIMALGVPVQIIAGRGDRIVPVAQAEALASRMTVHLLDDVGHLPHMERTAEVNRLIKGFIES